MSDRAEMTERHGRILAELAELGLSAARDLQQRQLCAETPKDAAVLANALHRISRSVRQSLALEAKLKRDAERQEIEDRDEVRAEAERRVAKRRTRVRAAMERLIWTEYEDAEANVLVDDLDMLLDEEELSDGFTADPVETHIARVCEELGLACPSPLAGEGVGPGPDPGSTDEGSRGERHSPSSAQPDSPTQPLIRPADAGHLLPQGEKGRALPDHPWRSSG